MKTNEKDLANDAWVIDNLETAQKIKELVETPQKPNEKLKKALEDYKNLSCQSLKDFKLF